MVRIRQVRPEFFTDAVTARLAIDVRLAYIGLWCIADDAGFLVWDTHQIGAQLFPYDTTRHREALIERVKASLIEAGRMQVFDCGCAVIPTLPNNQKIGGTKTFSVQERHKVHTRTDKSARYVRLGYGSTAESESIDAEVDKSGTGIKTRLGDWDEMLQKGKSDKKGEPSEPVTSDR